MTGLGWAGFVCGALTERSVDRLVWTLVVVLLFVNALWREWGVGIKVGMGSNSKLVASVGRAMSSLLVDGWVDGWEENATQPPSMVATEAAVMSHLVVGAPEGVFWFFFEGIRLHSYG